MKQYDNTNSGILGKNDRKRPDRTTEDGKVLTDPDLTGSINLNGIEYWLDGRIKISGPKSKKPGEKFIKLNIRPKDGMPDRRPPPKPQPTEANWDTIPFDDDKLIP